MSDAPLLEHKQYKIKFVGGQYVSLYEYSNEKFEEFAAT